MLETVYTLVSLARLSTNLAASASNLVNSDIIHATQQIRSTRIYHID
jgi:hypothetical protein